MSPKKRLNKGEEGACQVLVPLMDVLRHNDEVHLLHAILKLAKHVEAKPPFVFKSRKVDGFIRAISTAEEQTGGGAVTVPPESFKRAIILHVRLRAVDLGTTCIPCEIEQACYTAVQLHQLNFYPRRPLFFEVQH
ncbi:hypothetical protein JG687_00013223 [Phytophthora cactorum]|uniref:Uncharacterized protein n=1 Tax=Phytophthora cactorum TaxID=29920 RepID=A0A8T1U396_9STRA|nr:hypothetical protein JG687_00013223 [Phytophthora cactorum]